MQKFKKNNNIKKQGTKKFQPKRIRRESIGVFAIVGRVYIYFF